MGGWLDRALDNGYEIIPVEEEIVKKLEQMGYTRTVLPKKRYRQLKEDALTIDFSGWALVTHKWLPDKLAYAAIETVDERKKFIPVDDDRSLNMGELCQRLGEMSAAGAAPSGGGEVLSGEGVFEDIIGVLE